MALYAYTQSTQAVSAGGTVSFSASQRCGRSAVLDGNSVALTTPGVYRFEASFTGTTDAVGTLAIQAQSNGADVSGAYAAATIAAVGDSANLGMTFLVRVGQCGCWNRNAVAFVNSGDDATLDNAAVTVTRIG